MHGALRGGGAFRGGDEAEVAAGGVQSLVAVQRAEDRHARPGQGLADLGLVCDGADLVQDDSGDRDVAVEGGEAVDEGGDASRGAGHVDDEQHR